MYGEMHVTKIMLIVSNKYKKQCLKVKGCVRYSFAGLFCKSKREYYQNKEKCFLFHFENSSRSWDNQLLTF